MTSRRESLTMSCSIHLLTVQNDATMPVMSVVSAHAAVSGLVGRSEVSGLVKGPVCLLAPEISLSSHQMLHLSVGFIADAEGQLNSCEKSRELEIVPITRNFAKLCGSPSILRWVVSGRLLLHQTYSTTLNCEHSSIRQIKQQVS